MLTTYRSLVANNAPISTCLLWHREDALRSKELSWRKSPGREGIAGVCLHDRARRVSHHDRPRMPGRVPSRKEAFQQRSEAILLSAPQRHKESVPPLLKDRTPAWQVGPASRPSHFGGLFERMGQLCHPCSTTPQSLALRPSRKLIIGSGYAWAA